MKNKVLSLFIVITSALLVSCSEDDTVEQTLDIDFAADAQNITAGEEIAFEDLSIGNVTKWNWSFEGGTPPTSVLQNPVVVYETPGKYNVKLRVSNPADSMMLEREGFVVVSASAVNADFKVNKTNAIQGENVTFTDLSTGEPTSWKWEFISASGTNLSSTEQNPIISFEEPGVYSVKLTASNADNSNQIVKADYVTVVDVTSVQADFTADKTNTYAGGTVSFTDNSVGTATTWYWTFEGGTPSTSTEQNPEVVFNAPGRHTITLTASNDVKSSTVEKESFLVVVPGEELAVYYPFNGNANDAGPNGLSPESLGTMEYTGTDRNEVENTTALFDGSSGLVVPDTDVLNFGTSNYSVSLWIKTENTTKMMVWQESGSNGSGDNQTWLRMNDNSSDRLMRFATEDPGSGGILNLGTNDIPGGSLTDGVWHHVVAVREGLKTSIYLDGELAKEMTTSAMKHVSNEQDFKIGTQEQDGGYHSFYSGAMDDMIIYNKALTAAEVSELYNL